LFKVESRDARIWSRIGSLILFVFMVSYFTPISAKASNNIFYAGLGVPALVWWLRRPREAPGVFAVAPWFFAAFVALGLWLSVVDVSFVKDSLYVVVLFLCCTMLEQKDAGVRNAFLGFAVVSTALLAVAVFEWLRLWQVLETWPRVVLWGEGENPVYAALLIISALAFLWLFVFEERLARHSRRAFWAGLSVLILLCVLCVIVFQARSALIGFAAFFFAYVVQRRLIVAGLAMVAGILVVALLMGLGGALLERGLSFRLDIWGDAVRRLTADCGILLGCGRDQFHFLGQFFHPHSAYVSVLYHGGLIGLALFGAVAIAFFARTWRAGSRWLLVALIGWGGVLTTTGGVIASPRPLWVFFWIPTLMALLESGRAALETYYASRAGLRLPG